jgi:hypothetical protein
LLPLLGLVVATLAGALVWAFLVHDGRKDIDLGLWVGAEDAWTQSVMPGARWASDELCSDELPCIQAVTSETLTMYRFADRDEAVTVAEQFGEDGYLTGWIAVRYEPGGLTAAQRDEFEYGIGCINTWISEDGRDC